MNQRGTKPSKSKKVLKDNIIKVNHEQVTKTNFQDIAKLKISNIALFKKYREINNKEAELFR